MAPTIVVYPFRRERQVAVELVDGGLCAVYLPSGGGVLTNTFLSGLLLAGCAGSATDDSGGGHGEDTAAMTWSGEEATPTLSLDDISAQLLALQALDAPNGQDITSTFLGHLEQGDESCPGGGEGHLNRPADACQTSEGWYYEGIGWYDLNESEVGAGGEVIELSYYHGGDFVMFSPAGKRFAGGGDLLVVTTTAEGERVTEMDLKGTWVDEANPLWLGAGFSAVYTSTVTSSSEGMRITLLGGMSVGSTDLFLDDLSYGTTGTCPGALTGALQIRDARGFWTEWALGDDCDTCGEVIFHGDQDLGELCLDLSGWGESLLWLNAPR